MSYTSDSVLMALREKGVRSKLVIRLMAAVDERLREKIRRRGDLMAMCTEAINAADLDNIEAPEVDLDGGAPTTTLSLSPGIRRRLRAAAARRRVSQNALVNAALGAWLDL